MIISELQDIEKSGDGDDFTYSEIVDTVLYFWEVLLNFLNLIRDYILWIVTSNEKSLLKSTICTQCFRGIQGRKSTLVMSTPSTARSFNSLIKRGSSDDCNRKIRKAKRNEIDVQSIFYNQLKDLNILDSDINNNDIESSKNKTESTYRNGDNYGGKTSFKDTIRKKEEDIDQIKVAQYRDAIFKYSRISYSDFTSLFNKFVRENGRDFSKADLLHWVSRFTKFIYLKKEISGDSSELREQLALRAIQSKRNALLDRLYTLREPNEMNMSLEDYSENLRTSYLNPIKKLLNVIKGGAGDMNINGKETHGYENTSANNPKEINISEEVKSSVVNLKSNTIRTETLDLEQEKVSQNETGNNHLLQTTSTNRKKKTPRLQKKRKETECEQCPDLIDIENMYQNSKLHVLKEPPPNIDPSTLIKSDVFSTTTGLVRVSQYLDTSITDDLEHNRVQQYSSINSCIEYLEETDSLPEGTEIKPLPPGGLDEVVEKNKEFANREIMRQLYEKNKDVVHAKQITTTIPPEYLKDLKSESDLRDLEKKFHDGVFNEYLNGFKDFQDLPETLPSPKQINFEFASPGSVNPFVPEVKNTTTRERSSVNNAKRGKETRNQGTLPIKETKNKEQGNEEHRYVPVRRRLNEHMKGAAGEETDVLEKQPNETSNNGLKDTGSKEIKTEHNELFIKKVNGKKRSGIPIRKITNKVTEYGNDKHQKQNVATIKDIATTNSKCGDSRRDASHIEETGREDIDSHREDQNIHHTTLSNYPQIFDKLSPLDFIDTDNNDNEAAEAEQGPLFLETNATIDYSRHVVEPSHGDRPNKKKLQCKIKEKIKTKGEANKHLKAKKEKAAYYLEEEELDTTVEYGQDNEQEDSVTEESHDEHNVSTPVVNATEQPQILDDREYMMVPEEIIRITDPRLKDIEDKYSVASPAVKKDKKKRKDKKVKTQKGIPISFVSDFHH